MDFTKALQYTDSTFESILEIMKLRRNSEEVNAMRNLLVTTHLITDYFLNREDDQLKVSVIYFPECNENAQQICEEFICLKFGFYTNQEWRAFLAKYLNHNDLFVPSSIKTPKQFALLKENYKFENNLSQILSRSVYENYECGRTLIHSEYLSKCHSEYQDAQKSYNRKTANKYWYLSNAIIAFNKLNRSICPLSLTPSKSNSLYEYFVRNKKHRNIENIIVFPTKTPDGRYSDYCSDAFQKPYLDDYVNAESGLKNVFFFCFSKKPYRLRRLFDFKLRMKERIQIIDDDSYDFISFSHDESLKLNGLTNGQFLSIDIGKEDDETQQDYETLFDDITNGMDRHVSRRNEMSLCVPEKSSSACCKNLVEETEADESILNAIFKINANLWEKEASVKVRHFVYNDEVFVVTGNDINKDIKDNFGEFLRNQYNAKEVKFGTFGNLRGYQKNGTYENDIKEKKIIVVSYRSDYTESIFHKYPNSFDPICINSNQIMLVLSNYFLMRQYYEWGKYNYGKSLRKILKSEFRNSQMKPILVEYKKPTKNLPEDTREEEMDRNTTRTQQIEVVYEDNSKVIFARSEWMLYKYNKSIGIAPMSDLYDLYESCNGLSIQPITPLVRFVYGNYVDAAKDRDTQSEKMFKEQPQYGLSESEINSKLQLWKILLSKRVCKSSPKDVYDEIMSHFNERYIISFSSFRKWLEPDYGIPRARKMQKYLVEDYLGIRPPYINLIRRIKERTKNDTESINISIRHFLNIALLTNDYSNVLNSLSEEIKDLLGISNTDDVKEIINKVKNEIRYQSIKSIEQ